MLKSFFHTGFVVKDLEQTIEFYTNVLGLKVAGRMERAGPFACQLLAFDDAHIKGAFLEFGAGHQLELIQYLSPPSGPGGIHRNDLGASHLAFFVENIDQFYADTSQRGLRFNIRRLRCATTAASCCARRCTPRTPMETGSSSWSCSDAADDR